MCLAWGMLGFVGRARDAGTIAMGLGATAEVVARARARAEARGEPLVRVLAEDLDPEALAEGLADAVGAVVVQLEQGELDETALRLAGPDIAWRHLLLPLARTGAGLTVAFADPLDKAAVSAIATKTGKNIEALVAPVDEMLEALARLYGPAPAALPNEATQRLDGHHSPVTQPMHRLEDEATIEQRHRALVLALVDAGVVTHEAYLAALRRLVRHDDD